MGTTCNVVVLISGSGSNLQALIDSQHEGNPARIRAVIANRADAFGLTGPRAPASPPPFWITRRSMAARRSMPR